MALIRRFDSYMSNSGRRAERPRAGDRVRPTDYQYPPQPWLYHRLKLDSDLSKVRRDGLRLGDGRNWSCPDTKKNCRGRIWFSAQIGRWAGDYDGPILRVPTAAVRCIYDGAEWLYDWWDGDDEQSPWFKEFGDGDAYEWRMSDCYSTESIPAHLIEVWDASQKLWRSLAVGRKAGIWSDRCAEILLFRETGMTIAALSEFYDVSRSHMHRVVVRCERGKRRMALREKVR